MLEHFHVGDGIHVLPSALPVPQMGQLPVNAYFVHAKEPYLVDTGMFADSPRFLAALESLVELEELRWIYLTHDDGDHIGSLHAILARAPNAKVITTFVGMGKLGLLNMPLEEDRVYLLNPGEKLHLGDRELSVLRPPVFDSPASTCVYDNTLDALFSADAFGTVVEGIPASANEIPGEALAQGQRRWAGFDAPWIHGVDRERFGSALRGWMDLNPRWILSAHLPPAREMARTLCANLAGAPEEPPFVGPNQAAFEAMLKQLPPEQEPAPA